MFGIYVVYTKRFVGRFTQSPEYQWLLQKFGQDTLRAIHDSLNIEDKISAIIRAERIK